MNEYGIIFDMDGVLIDSYHAHFQSWAIMAEMYGESITEDDFARLFGRTSRSIIAMIWEGLHFSDEKIAEMDVMKEKDFRDIIKNDFPAMPGAVNLLQSIADTGCRLAVGSSGPIENISLVIEKLGAENLFDAIVTGNDVQRGKPDPEVFLIAADRLGLPPAQCLVVEDAEPGVAAAKNAGMAVAGLLSTGHQPHELANANLTVPSLAELSPEKLAGLIEEKQAKKL